MRRLTSFLFIRAKLAGRASGTALRRLRDLVFSASDPTMDAAKQQREGLQLKTPRGPHGVGPGVRSFGIVSADRQEYTPEQTTYARKALKQALAGMGTGYVTQRGLWRELVKDSHGPAQMKIPVNELSFVVFGCSLADIRRLSVLKTQDGSEVAQDAIIYSGPENGGKIQVIGDGWADTLGDFKALGTMDQDVKDEAHENRSTMRGHDYVFASAPRLCRPRR
jgi:hypothetical protein